MKEIVSLRTWALMIIIMPTVVIGLLLGGYLTYKRYTELDQNLIERGVFLSEPLTILAATAISEGKQKKLGKALELAHLKASPIVKSISIFLPNHQLFMSSNIHTDFDKIRIKPGRILADNTSVEIANDDIFIRSPIFGTEENADSFVFVTKNGKTLYGYLVVELSRDQALLAQQSSIVTLVLLITLSIAFTLIFAFKFIGNIINPIQGIKNTIAKIVSGDVKAKINTAMLGELNELRLGVNAIGKSIHIANERAEHNISEQTQELQQTVEQLEVKNIELNIARRHAQEGSDVKSQFLANMSHELRTPLNGVLGFARQLRKTPLNTNQKDFVDTIENSANNLLRIINDILDFSKLDAEKMSLESIPFALRDTVNEVMTLLAPGIFDKGLEIHLAIDPRIPDNLQGDPVRLKQIIINLLGNSIKFTRHGYIRLDVMYLGSNTKGQHIKFTVTDTGVGVDKDKQDKLFAAFGQADSSTTRKFGGTGLGLIISQKLVEAMDGNIHFSSEANKGSEFYFDIFVKEHNAEINTAVSTKVIDGKRILFFDNNNQSYNDISLLLREQTDLVVISTESQQEYERLLSVESFDLVLIGKKVSPSNISELKQLVAKAVEKCSNVYAIINSISPNLKEVVVGAGAKACLSMPVNQHKLFSALVESYLAAEEEDLIQSHQLSNLKVLAVDDTEANLKLLQTLLHEMQVTCETAKDGQQALELAKKVRYDVIFMDIQMPVMDGITATKKIRESSINEDTPIIAVTAHSGAKELEQMKQANFSEYLAKPIDEDMLHQVILDASVELAVEPVVANRDGAIVDQGQPITLPEITQYPLLDWDLALSRAAGKPQLAIDMFQLLLQSLPESHQNMTIQYEQKNIEALLKTVHKFHGACCYTGVPELRRLAETIESGLKANNSITEVEPELLELLDEMNNLMIFANNLQPATESTS